MSRRRSCLLVLSSLVITVIASLGAVWAVNRLQPSGRGTRLLTATIPAIALPSPTLRPSGTPRPQTYVVQRGDTLSIIALQFGVSVEALMKANKLTDADIIFVGQTLVIPASGAQGLETVIPVATPSTTVTTSLLTATAAVLPASTAIVEIDEIIYPGDLARETVIIVNRGNRARKLSGWTLTAPDGGHYTFPNYNLWPGSSVRVHSVAGTDTITDLFWGRSVPAWSGRDRGAVLRDNTGRIIYEYP